MVISFCSSKDCKNYVSYDVNGNPPAPKFCGKCGSQMIAKCQDCGAYRYSSGDEFCTNCGKPYLK